MEAQPQPPRPEADRQHAAFAQRREEPRHGVRREPELDQHDIGAAICGANMQPETAQRCRKCAGGIMIAGQLRRHASESHEPSRCHGARGPYAATQLLAQHEGPGDGLARAGKQRAVRGAQIVINLVAIGYESEIGRASCRERV